MQEFVAIDFETANPKRVSACALGYAKVANGEVTESNGYLIKPVGGHAVFQTQIHGIDSSQTFDKPDFKELFPRIDDIFRYPLVAHSPFDKQVLNALSGHFNLQLSFEYIDSCALAKGCLPQLSNCKLKTLVKHFGLPPFRHHDATEDAIACANIYLKLLGMDSGPDYSCEEAELHELKGFIEGILADDVVDYKEVCGLIYLFEDHPGLVKDFGTIYSKLVDVMKDDHLDSFEAKEVAVLLKNSLQDMV
jgi:DNA polymerase-3 subunit epsilon